MAKSDPMSSTPSTSMTRREPGSTLLADRAYEGLRDQIVTLKIKPGQPIDEDRVGAELGMGRTPVREAIKRLALERLVTVFPRRGTFASDINITDLAQISDVRTIVEPHAARRAAERLTPARREELEGLMHKLGHESESWDNDALMDLDARVHRFIYGCADNPYLEETCSRYFNLSLRIWYLAVDRMPGLSAHITEHGELLAAIRDGDGEGAARMLCEHVQAFESAIRAVL
jgi:DNA-binding GntR family transcriptional regulator